ncbi:hypothetical protein FAUST_4684 [Fusarium austroamericanum]|uniref:Uncharacterized protein n=1 Tax=Fusarium austroamericanum TaxID=282268 RepID=A0AAN6C2I6_FUSAU|nr:hypothetical protein FAUST_4684 [Fusarium austroamericanum]
MRSAFLLSTFGFSVFTTIHGFEFTGPSSAEKLDLTQPITITWNATSGSIDEPKARRLQLWFLALTEGEKDQSGWELASNLSLSEGSYKWDPETIVKGIEDKKTSLSSGAVHNFGARLLDNSGSMLVTVESDKYALKGGDFIANDGSKGVQTRLYAALTMAVVAGVITSMGVI